MLTVNLEHVFGAGLLVEVVYALRDDDHGASLLPQPGLTLRDGQMCHVGLHAQSQLTSVLVELPDPGWGAREGFWGCQILGKHQHHHVKCDIQRQDLHIFVLKGNLGSFLKANLAAAHNRNQDYTTNTVSVFSCCSS